MERASGLLGFEEEESSMMKILGSVNVLLDSLFDRIRVVGMHCNNHGGETPFRF